MKKLHFRGAIVHKNVQLSKMTPIWPLTYSINGGGVIQQCSINIFPQLSSSVPRMGEAKS